MVLRPSIVLSKYNHRGCIFASRVLFFIIQLQLQSGACKHSFYNVQFNRQTTKYIIYLHTKEAE